jgi:hypothetical protein
MNSGLQQMPSDAFGTGLSGGTIVLILLALFVIITIYRGIRVVPQSEKFVVERFGRLRSVLNPGLNIIVPWLDRVAHKVSVLERQLPTSKQDAITSDNVLVAVDISVFYRITEPEKTVYRIRDVDAAISTTVAGIVRSEIGRMELDQVQSNRSSLIGAVKTQLAASVRWSCRPMPSFTPPSRSPRHGACRPMPRPMQPRSWPRPSARTASRPRSTRWRSSRSRR